MYVLKLRDVTRCPVYVEIICFAVTISSHRRKNKPIDPLLKLHISFWYNQLDVVFCGCCCVKKNTKNVHDIYRNTAKQNNFINIERKKEKIEYFPKKVLFSLLNVSVGI